MSKGSNFWGTARGRLGNMVISSVRGQQIERKYQPKVANPKTFAQMRQRAAFAAAVKFFKHSQQNLFRFAFEDKTQKESDYNAFMRHNVAFFAPYNKTACDNPSLPALGFASPVLMSYGSLPAAQNVQFYKYQADSSFALGFVCGTHGTTGPSGTATWGDISKGIIKYYDLQDGDIITIVVIATDITASNINSIYINGEDAEEPQKPARWTLWQKRVDSSSTEEVGDKAYQEAVFCIKDGIEGDVLVKHHFGAVIFSRNIAGKSLIVSSSSLVASVTDYSSVWPTKGSDKELQVLTSWGANPEAILKGSLS